MFNVYSMLSTEESTHVKLMLTGVFQYGMLSAEDSIH